MKDKPRAENRRYCHQKYGKCGKNDRGVAVEFQHMDLNGFNRALDNYLQDNDPEYSKRKAYWGKHKK
jgi:hypothetical protein